MGEFVHLHNHSHYSLQDAACTIEQLVNAAVEKGQKALALTDHGVMHGCGEFYKKAKKAGIKPILGTEAYIVQEGSRFDKGGQGRKRSGNYNHIVLLAKNTTGYHNLVKLSSIGYLEGFYYKPRIDMEVLEKYKDGIVCTSACLAGPVSAQLVNGNYEKAKEIAIRYKELFGDDFYLEIQDHGLEKDQAVLQGVPKLAKELGIKIVATNDIHYIERDHALAHNILLLLGDKSGKADYRELRYKTDQVYFKSTEEMIELFKDYPGAIENTVEIAEKCNFDFEFSGFHTPLFPIPEDSKAKNLDEYFELLAVEGLHERFDVITPEIQERFDYEIGVIKQMGYSGYFLIVHDFINASKDRGIPVGPGRGSAAGSLVAYALSITNVDPLEYDLLFERFLNPERKSMPDIDVDFADDQRGDAIEYTKQRYGYDSVCQIITYNRLSSKAVLKDVARVLKIPIATVNNITKWIPSKFGKVFSIEQSLEEVAELKWVKESTDPQIQDLIKYGKILEGMNRNASKHAAGVVITPGSVSDFVPLARAGAEGDIVTQYNMKELDTQGILKMDFLGLRTLSIIRDALKLIKKNRGIEFSSDDIPLDDQKTFDMISKGQTSGVFQFESGPMREYLKMLAPRSIKDISAMNALYRPGPMEFIEDFIEMRHGRKEITYLHPLLEPILKETYGIIVYQEQVIQIANKIAGMTLAEADILRRAMGKKDKAAMVEQQKKFVDGAVANKVEKKIAENIFVVIDKFANYGFNKSHAVAYSLVAYHTAYLKANYLPEFLAANLTNEFNNTEKVTSFLDDCRKLKVPVRPPTVNRPAVYFDVDGDTVIFGMCAIKNVGINAIEELARKRKELGRDFTSIYDLCMNIDTRTVNKRVLEGLVKAGALDELSGSRAQNFLAIEEALSFGAKAQNAKNSQMDSLFGEIAEEMEIPEPELPDVQPWNVKEKLAKEREVLGFYLSDHPLRKFEREYKSFASVHLGEPATYEGKDYVVAAAVVTDIRTKLDKSGNQMAFFKIDDFTGSCEGIMFSKIYSEFGACMEPEGTVLVKGRLENSGDMIKIHAEEAYPLDEVKYKMTNKILLYATDQKHDAETIKKLKNIMDNYSGDIPVFMCVKDNGNIREFYLSYKVEICDGLINDLTDLLGENGFKYIP